MKTLRSFRSVPQGAASVDEGPPIFDIPMTYNSRVKFWIRYFQTSGRKWFKVWLERLPRYMPAIQKELHRAGLPRDLAYIVMIESGFSSAANSPARAVGPWQFMEATGTRYGLQTNWWLDERRDVEKSTRAAVRYLGDLYRMFQSWYLVAASYNAGEGRIKRLIERYQTHDFWRLAHYGAFNAETMNYVPKLLAATLIAKAPALYGFRDVNPLAPLSFEYAEVPGGIDLSGLASFMGVTHDHLTELNPELIRGWIPAQVPRHRIRVPKGARRLVQQYSQQRSSPAKVVVD